MTIERSRRTIMMNKWGVIRINIRTAGITVSGLKKMGCF
jgi:hypothetical protein